MKCATGLRVSIVLAGFLALGSLPVSVRGGPPTPATDDDIQKMIAAAGDVEDYHGANLVYVLDEADVHVRESGLALTESCQVIKILTDAGIRSKSVLRWEFDSDTYRITVKSVRIHRKDESIEAVDLASLTTKPASQHAIYWGNERHLLSVPRLEIGDALEIRTSRIGFNIAYLAEGDAGSGGPSGAGSGGEGEGLVPPMPGHWYEVTLFQSHYPILHKRYSVHMPKDMPVQYEVYNGSLKSSLWFDGDTHVYTWSAQDIPAVKSEPRMVALDDCATKLVMATLKDWESKSRWFHRVNEPQFDADDAIRAKVAELTAGLTTDEEKIAACTHWVADNIRYYGTKQGGPCEGYTLHNSAVTFRDRGGVCKDKAGMLVTMLRVLGHEVYPALTMAGSRVEKIPADQFNHTVTVMRNKDRSFRVLDPTWVPLSRDLWSTLEQQQGLVYGTPEGQDVTRSPYFDPEVNKRQVHSQGRIHEDGTLSTRITYDLDGAAGGRLRRNIHGSRVSDRRGAFEEVLNIAPNARIEELSFIDPYDYTRDGFVDMTVSAEGYAAGGDGVHLFRLPLMSHPLNNFFRPRFMQRRNAKERKYGMSFWATRLLRYEEELKLPRGWKVIHAPEAKTLDSPSVALSFEADVKDGSLTYRFEFRLKKGTVPAEDYVEYKKALDTMYELGDAWVVCAGSDGREEPEEQASLPAATLHGGTR